MTASLNNLPSMIHHRTLSNLSSQHEDLFSSITGLDDLGGSGLGDDDLSYDDIDDSLLVDGSNNKTGGPARKGKGGRNASSTAEKKATHNAVERARRESLNARFLVLADMLPGMVSSRDYHYNFGPCLPLTNLFSLWCSIIRPKSNEPPKPQSSTNQSI